MSRRPISSQGKSKPDVKSYPTRPSSSTSKQKKSGKETKVNEKENKTLEERLKALELNKEYKRQNEELNMDFPMIAKECADLIANFQFSDQEFEEEMRKAALPADVELLDGDDLESIGARQRAYRRMNDELNEKNAHLAKECSAILARYDPSLVKDLEEVMAIRSKEPDSETTSVQAELKAARAKQEAFREKQAKYKRINDELERDSMELTKQVEEFLGAKLDDIELPNKNKNKKPPAARAGIKKSESAKQVKRLLDNIEAVERSASQSQLDDQTDNADSDMMKELSEEVIAADFSKVVRRIEAKLGGGTGTDQPTPVTDTSKEIRGGNEGVAEVTTRPATAPAPVPKAAAIRARGPIDDLEPPEEVGAEAIQRFLKAKLRVLQEELDRASEEIAQKNAELQQCKKELIGKQEQSSQLDKQVSSLRAQSEKQQKRLDLATKDLDNSKIEIAGLKRELESQQRSQKKVDNTQSAMEVRLNRALEEVDKYKLAIQQMKGDSKDSQQSTSKRMEGLQAENKMLFKQREELMTGFKKQMKLIDNLKRQKMHMEAAKMLAFSEEEFMRVLDWWKVSD